MNKRTAFAMIPLLIAIACSAQTQTASNAAPADATPPAAPGSISVQQMLVTGPTQLKLHSLAMITQGNVKGAIDESYLPGLKVCAEDPALPLRSVTAQILGTHYVQGKDQPNPEAVALLMELAKDESSYVRYNAVYYGLSQLKSKSDDVIALLIDIATTDREQGLFDRIAESLKPDTDRVVKILNTKLAEGNDIATYEIFESLTGQKPENADKYLDMPSSLPRLFIFKVTGSDAEAYKSALAKALKEAGLENPNLLLSGEGANAVVSLRTYITRDRITVENGFADHPEFKISQTLWLTPEMDIQLQQMEQK